MEVLSQTAGETVCVSKGSEGTWETISELTNGGQSRLQPQTPIKKTARDDRIGATETGRDGTESNSKSDAKPSSKSETSPSEGTESNLLPPNMPSTVDRSPTRPNVSPREHLVRAYNGVSFTANVVTAAAICVLITTRHFATQGSGSYAEESQSTFDSLPSDEMVPLEDMEMDGSEDGGTDEDDSADINTEINTDIDADVTIDVTLESTTMASNADAITDHGDITDLSSADEISTDRDSDARTALSKPQAERSTEASPLPALSPNRHHQQKQKQQPRDEDFVISALSKMACRGILPEWKYNPPEPSSPDVGVGIAHNDHETVVSELTRDSTWTPAPSRLVASIPDKLSSMAIPSGRKWRNRLLARKRQLSKQKIAEREAMEQEQEQEQNQAEQIQVEKKHEEQQPTQDLSETAVEEVNPNPTHSSASVCASRSLWTEVTVEEDEEEFPTNHRLRSHPFDETNVNDTTYIPWLNPSDEDEGDAVSSVWTEVTVPNQDTESLTAARLGSPFEKTKEDTTNKTQPSESEFSFVTAEGEVDERESLRSFLTAASTAEVEVPPLSMLDADSEHETDSRCDSMVSVESFAAMYAWLMSNVWATSPNKPKIEIPGDDESTTRESGAPQSLDETAAQDNDEELDDDINSSTTDTREPAESPCLPDPPSRVVSDRDVYFDSGDEKLNDDPQEQACIELVLDLGTTPSVASSVTLSERTIRIFTYTLEPSHISPGPVSTVWCCDWGLSSGFGTEDKGASDGMLSVVPTAMSATYRAYDSGDSSIDSSTLRGSSKTTRTKKKHKPQPWYVVPMKVDLLDPKPVDGDEPSVIRRNEVMRPRNPDDSRFERVMEMVHFRTSLENDCRLPPE
eukprot:CAMPEP_0172392650 /NCGR_PEP_ID=MMETSP1061-20121228/8713_1 /TAXON_ID=37318 /ORGANISM="Pseudo-nitzschia pungens, Strain cf. pungens" /LENGTH=857 /DNA_ID=CAMNT_0013123527 /DNA_START=263 /DNA_END=2836 /DNA_ORIENTATION=+